MNIVATNLTDHAVALANVTQLVEDLTEARAVILQLRADLHREQDRCVMLVDEMNRWRDDALKQRALNNEYETTIANIGLMTVRAQESLHASKDLPPRATEAIEKLDAEFKQGNQAEAK